VSDDAKMWETLNCLPDAVEHMIHGDPDEPDSVKASDAVRWAAAEIARLREERRWIPVGERLPDVGEWFDVAGKWGNDIAWYTGFGWQNPRSFGIEVTHWRKRTPGPEGEKPELPTG